MKPLHEVSGYGRAMRRYASFSGRSTRSEFWLFTLTSGLMSFGASLIDHANHTGGIFNLLVLLVHALPSVSVFVRRMHDVARSGWWFLAPLTVVGLIPVFIFLCQRSTPGPNRYGLPDGAAAAAAPAVDPTGAVATTPSAVRDPIREIERLAELHARGAITDAEFAHMKAAVFTTPEQGHPAPRLEQAPSSSAR